MNSCTGGFQLALLQLGWIDVGPAEEGPWVIGWWTLLTNRLGELMRGAAGRGALGSWLADLAFDKSGGADWGWNQLGEGAAGGWPLALPPIGLGRRLRVGLARGRGHKRLAGFPALSQDGRGQTADQVSL